MRTWMTGAAMALALGACTKDAPEAPTKLVGEMKQALAERERRLASYHLVADTTQGAETAHHEFFFRAPNHSRGTATGGLESASLAFDGKTLYRLNDAEKKLEAYELQLPPAKAALVLATMFRPFAPDGFRSPLLPSKGVTAKAVTHPMGPQAVELTVLTKDEDGGPLEVTYVLRAPSADFLAKRTRSGQHLGELTVEAERCEPALKLCVPTKLKETRDGELLGTTTLTTVELNPELPVDSFKLEPPEGYTVQQRVMKEN
jgi:outer membrane lipoprotein-sorting protein